jgi:hypothetical protein
MYGAEHRPRIKLCQPKEIIIEKRKKRKQIEPP